MNRVECLDGLRGLAALWVLLGHAMLLTGFRPPLLSQPDLGVDLFILLSGFLMVFQYNVRSAFEDWDLPKTWVSFWLRRFFRIAPLFYVTLFFALAYGPELYADRMVVDAFLGGKPQAESRYLDDSLTNIVLHVSFLFGLIPNFAYRTPLPDWSLGLEMQFYAVFPLVVLLARKAGWIAAAFVAGATGVVLATASSAVALDFPMPAFLPLKFHVFVAGMLIAAAGSKLERSGWVYLAVACAFVALPIGPHSDRLHVVVRVGMVVAFFALLYLRQTRLVDSASILLGKPFFHWLGELSFGAYLIHLLLMQPAAAWAIHYLEPDSSASARFILVSAVVLPSTYTLALLGYWGVELPGQRLGKICVKKLLGSRNAAQQTVAEKIAAP